MAITDPLLAAFEAARADRAQRTDYPGHVTTRHPKSGAEIVDMARSAHRDRTEHLGPPADLAREYVDLHPELETTLGTYSLEELVVFADMARVSGQEDLLAQIDAWLMAEYPPQHVGTTVLKEISITQAKRLRRGK